jgi:PKD repeat protein
MFINKIFILSILFVSSYNTVSAQCNPVLKDRNGNNVKNATYCQNELVPFFANSPGYTTTKIWDFGDGTTSSLMNPLKAYSNPGTYTVKYTGTGGAGTCYADLKVTIKSSPKINFKLTNSSSQCFEGNQFCFVDSSKPATGSKIIRQSYLISNGVRIDTLNPIFPIEWCHTFNDPNGGYYNIVVESEDSNGCISRINYDDLVYVHPKIGAEITRSIQSQTIGCDSTLGKFRNISDLAKTQAANFSWDFGDGTYIYGDTITNTNWWNGADDKGVEHKYTTSGTFDVTLKIQSKFGCRDSFTYKSAITNVKLVPEIYHSKTIYTDAEQPIHFKLKDGPIIGANFWTWNFGDPTSGSLNTNSKDFDPKHSYTSLGPKMISFRVVAGPCDVIVFDTIQIIGPRAQIEAVGNRVSFSDKYQCSGNDSIHFTNNSSFYYNDSNTQDEDSITLLNGKTAFVFNFNASNRSGDQTAKSSADHISNRKMGSQVWRVWNFGDEYAEQCTTDSKNNLNIGKNCNYSTDEFPVHKYQNWDSVYYNNYFLTNDSFCEITFNESTKTCSEGYIDTTRKALHRSFFHKNIAHNYTATLWLKDTVSNVESSDQVDIILTRPDASKLEIKAGNFCPLDGSNINHYLTFDMNTGGQSYFAVNFDSLADPTNFIPFNSGSVLALPAPGSALPFSLPYSLSGAYPDKFVKGYTPGEININSNSRHPEGSFTIGLIVGNGPLGSGNTAPACVDTAWYHNLFRIPYLNADFEIVEPSSNVKSICAGKDAYFLINNPIQNEIKTLRWSWGYQGIGKGSPNALDVYLEEFHYLEKYNGPVANRNDSAISYNGENWLFNYIVRKNLDDIEGLEVIDTIVTSIVKEWKYFQDINSDLFKQVYNQSTQNCYIDLPKKEFYKLYGDGTFGCIDTSGLDTELGLRKEEYRRYNGDDVIIHNSKRYRFIDSNHTDSIEVAHILHFRDSSLQGYDTLIKDTDTTFGVWKKTYKYKSIQDGKIVLKPASGPMIPTLYLNNTNGCESRNAKWLNVGFLNDFWLENETICNGLAVRLEDTLRYWQFGEQDPPTFPIYPYDFWNDVVRYTINKETYEMDWDESDGLGPIWERSIFPNHTYDEPGEYTITVVSKDSMNCRDTVRIKAYITDVTPNFGLSSGLLNCASLVNFTDSSKVADPCSSKDTCSRCPKISCDSIIKYEWSFGDGTRKSLLKNPSHEYTKGGFFDVKLKVWTALGCLDSIVKRIQIPGPKPEFEFDKQVWNDYDSATICIGDFITIKNISGGDKTNPNWEMYWGDGFVTNIGDSGQTAKHQYKSAGTFELYLIATDLIPGTTLRCSRIYPDTNVNIITKQKVLVKVIDGPVMASTVSKSYVCKNESINFSFNGNSLYNEITWNFGDGSNVVISSPSQVQQHTYLQSGTFYVVTTGKYTSAPFEPYCPDTAIQRVTVNTCTLNLTDFDKSISIHPNPNNGLFYLNTSELLAVQKIELINMLGESVDLSYAYIGEGKYEIVLESVKSGTYSLKLISDSRVVAQKITIYN